MNSLKRMTLLVVALAAMFLLVRGEAAGRELGVRTISAEEAVTGFCKVDLVNKSQIYPPWQVSAYWVNPDDGGDGTMVCPEEDPCDGDLRATGPNGAGLEVRDGSNNLVGYFNLSGTYVDILSVSENCGSPVLTWNLKFIHPIDPTQYVILQPTFQCEACSG